MTFPKISILLQFTAIIIIICLSLSSCNRQDDERVARLNRQIDSLTNDLQYSRAETKRLKHQAEKAVETKAKTDGSIFAGPTMEDRMAELYSQIDSLNISLQNSWEAANYWKDLYRQEATASGKIVNPKTDSLKLLEIELINDLRSHKELLPQEKRCESASAFFYEPSSIRPINDHWVIASFEDGLCGGVIILEYEREAGTIKWKPITYIMD